MDANIFELCCLAEEDHWWFRARHEIIISTIEKIHKLRQGDSILDIGCGSGAFLEYFQKQGCKVTGIDSSYRAVERCRARGLANVIQGDVGYMKMPQDGFDIVTMFDVLEHIDDDMHFLQTVRTLMQPKGCVLITVPAFQWLWTSHDEKNHHKRRYKADQILDLLNVSGLKPIHETYFNTLLFPLALVRKFMDVFDRDISESGVAVPWAPVNHLFYEIFRLEKKIINNHRLPYGVSYIVAATPK